MLLNLSTQEQDKLYKLAQDKITIEALKKMFLNDFMKESLVNDVHHKAASYLAIQYLEWAFKTLAILQPKEQIISKEENMV